MKLEFKREAGKTLYARRLQYFLLNPPDGPYRAYNTTAAGKGRPPLMVVALLDVLRSFPGQIPDLDAVLSTADVPCVPRCGFLCVRCVFPLTPRKDAVSSNLQSSMCS